MDATVVNKGQTGSNVNKLALLDFVNSHDVQNVIKTVLELKDDAMINWLEHLFFPFSKKVARLPSLFSPASHIFNQDWTYTLGGTSNELAVVWYPQRQNTNSLWISTNPSSPTAVWNGYEDHRFGLEFKQMRLTGAGMTYEYIGSEQYMKGYAYQSVQYSLFSGNANNANGAPVGQLTSSIVQDSDWYSGQPVTKENGGYVRFIPKDDISFFKYYDTTYLELDGDLNADVGQNNWEFSDKDVALVFLFEGLNANEGPIIKFHFTRGIEALPVNAKQDFYGPTKCKSSRLFKNAPIQSMANNYDKLVTSKFNSSHPSQSLVKSVITNAISSSTNELGNILSLGSKLVQNDAFRGLVSAINPEAGAIVQGLDMGSRILGGDTSGGVYSTISGIGNAVIDMFN